MRTTATILALSGLLLCGTADAGPSIRPFFRKLPGGFTDALYVNNIPNPTAHCWTPDGRMFGCEKGNATTKLAGVRVVKSGGLLGTAFHTLTVNTDGERGLLGIAVDPNFASNRFVYVYYSNSSPMENRVSRLTASVGNPDVSDGTETIIKHVPIGDVYHNGGAIHFGPDGKLYVAVGDSHSSGADSQNPNVMGGKILRINPDGSIPGDNPTSYQGGLTVTGGPKEGWCCGLRNPYTFAFQPGTGLMYINDVGQGSWEEVNVGAIGKNYGWQGGSTDGIRNNASYTDPIHAYNHTGACAITGGTFYNPSTVMFPASYVGKYFFADYCGNTIKYITPGTPAAGASLPSTAWATTVLSGPVDLTIGPDGALYYSAQNSNSIGRISYTAPASQAIVLSTSSLTIAEGGNGTFTAQLQVMPGASVTVDVARSAGDANISAAPPTLTFTTGNWNTPQTVTVSSVAVPNGVNQTATISCSSSGLTTQNVAVTATDGGVAGAPVATISKPNNGEVVSGASSEFFGNGSATAPATLVKADFYVDGVLRSTDPYDAGTGHFHFGGSHNSWNTTTLADGVHVLRMVVTDSNGATGADQRVVVVANGTSYTQDATSDHIVSIEADRYSQKVGGSGAAAGHAWTVSTAFPGYSGTYAFQATPNDDLANINSGYQLTSPRLDFLVNFNTTGTHYVWVRGYGPDGASDSCHVGLDGAEVATSDRITGFPNTWTWSNQTMDGPVATINVTVAGVHGISVWMREDGFAIDKVVLTTNASLATPLGAGPAVSAGAPAVGSTGGGSGGGGGGGGGGCGLSGLEAAALLGLLRIRRRRR